jgi:hypothetical protein
MFSTEGVWVANGSVGSCRELLRCKYTARFAKVNIVAFIVRKNKYTWVTITNIMAEQDPCGVYYVTRDGSVSFDTYGPFA